MPTKNPKRIGGAVVMAALVVAALVAATAPGAMARHGEDHPVVPGGTAAGGSNNCSAEFTLPFDSQESESLSRPDDPVDTWVADIGNRGNLVEFDIDPASAPDDDMIAQLYEKDGGSCSQIGGNESVATDVEFGPVDDDQKYWVHVELDESTDVAADYTIIVQDV